MFRFYAGIGTLGSVHRGAIFIFYHSRHRRPDISTFLPIEVTKKCLKIEILAPVFILVANDRASPRDFAEKPRRIPNLCSGDISFQ